MIEAMIKRFTPRMEFTSEDIGLIRSLRSFKSCMVPSRELVLTDERRGKVSFVLSGWVCQYGYLQDGRRQILSLVLPGDVVIGGQFTRGEIEPALHTLTEAVFLDVPLDRFDSLCAASPRLAALIRQANSVRAATSREWILSLGARTAKERCAHLICEIAWRLRSVNLVFDGWFDFLLTQDELGHAIGATTVTVNKVLQKLRHENLIEQHGRRMRVVDHPAIESVAFFDPSFLIRRQVSLPHEMLLESSFRTMATDAHHA